METVKNQSKFPLALIALMISALAIGTAEFVIMGILENVAADLQVTLSGAGLLVTGYALGVAVGGPIITTITGRMDRKKLLIGLMLIFVLGNLLCALASNYAILMLARVISSLAHGTFFGVGSIIATRIVPPEKKASAIAMMFSGLTIANILGVPFGTFIGQLFGWRSTFGVVTLFGVISVLGLAFLLPKVNVTEHSTVRKEMRVLRDKQVLLTLLMTILGYGGVFTAFTYVAPILTGITGFSPGAVTPILLLFGVGTTIGNTVGGKLSDWKLMPSLVGILVLLAGTMAVFSISSHNKTAAIATVFIWGFAAFASVPTFQMRVLDKAKDAPNLASSLNISSFNLANAGGAYLGGLVIDSSLGLSSVSLVAATVTLSGLIVTLISWYLDGHKKEYPGNIDKLNTASR
jgi:MFS transporter, DHA1 family, inner membrane transport protein